MEWNTFTFLTLVASCISVLGAIVSTLSARKNNVRELENDVSEIGSIVEKVYRESRRQQMRRVREAAPVGDFPVPQGMEPGAPVQSNLAIPDKNALRRMAFGGKPQ